MLRNYIEKVKTYSNLRYFVELSFLAVFLSFIVSVTVDITLLSLNIQIPDWAEQSNQIIVPGFDTFYLAIILAPLLETVLGQMLPVLYSKKKRYSLTTTIILSSFVFMIMHVPVVMFFPAAFVLGIIFVISYIAIDEKSGRANAFLYTTGVHAIHNLIAFVSTIIF